MERSWPFSPSSTETADTPPTTTTTTTTITTISTYHRCSPQTSKWWQLSSVQLICSSLFLPLTSSVAAVVVVAVATETHCAILQLCALFAYISLLQAAAVCLSKAAAAAVLNHSAIILPSSSNTLSLSLLPKDLTLFLNPFLCPVSVH